MALSQWMRCGGVAAVFFLAACGGDAATSAPPTTPNAAQTGGDTSANDAALDDGIRDHHRHHHGGVVQFISLSMETLGVSADQKAQLEKIKSDLQAKTAPAHDAEKVLLSTLADGVAAGNVDQAKVDAALAQLATATSAAHDASLASLNDLHAALRPEQRAALVDKVEAHLAVWRKVNAEEQQGSHEKNDHLAKFGAEEGLTADQIDKISTQLRASPAPDMKADAGQIDAFMTGFRAFEGESFDAKTLSSGRDASGRLARSGASRIAHFYAVAAPVLTPEQRTKVAQHIRDRQS